MKRILISLTLILLTTFGVVTWLKFTQRDEYVIEVVNKSNQPLGAVQLMGLGNFGRLGRMTAGESRRLALDQEQAKKSVYLAFGASDEIERNTGWCLNDQSNAGRAFHRLVINADNSVTVHHDRR